MNAIKVADKLMHSYRIEEAELALAEGLGEIKVDLVDQTKFGGLNAGRNRHKVQAVIWDIETYCEVEIVLKTTYDWSKGHNVQGVHIIGDRPDVEMFWYLVDVIRDAMDREYTAWKRRQQSVGRGAKASFQLAMARRLSQRLIQMTRERTQERKDAEQEAVKALGIDADEVRYAVANGDIKALSSSMALVVASAAEVKQQAVQSAYDEAYGNKRLGAASGFGYRGGTSAASAGAAAGNRVNFGRPVSGSTKGLLR